MYSVNITQTCLEVDIVHCVCLEYTHNGPTLRSCHVAMCSDYVCALVLFSVRFTGLYTYCVCMLLGLRIAVCTISICGGEHVFLLAYYIIQIMKMLTAGVHLYCCKLYVDC